MTSTSLMGRFSNSRNRSPILPLHNSPKRDPSEYDLEELEPRPDDHVFAVEELPRASLTRLSSSPSPDAWEDKTSSAGSPSKFKPRALFAGPPPPIAASAYLKPRESKRRSPSSGRSSRSPNPIQRSGMPSLLFDYRQDRQATSRRDSVWRGIKRREKALEEEVQQLLDLQASGLIAGSTGTGPSVASDLDTYSDTGSSTPTGTFYSTATSKSRMVASLHVPTRSTRDGNVIPVRQPKRDRPRGLRSARAGLRRSLAAFAELKAEEEVHVNEALAQREDALGHLAKLQTRRKNISTELHNLEEAKEEPLGQELRQLAAQDDALTQDIRQLEEKLVGMRNRRRWVRGKMDEVRNRREAGLSGYKGALQEVDADTSSLMRRPPIQPLDLEALRDGIKGIDEATATVGGEEFLRLRPERRTAEMAQAWWESEVWILEKRKLQIERDRHALEDGGAMWADVISLVTGYETRLRELMHGAQSSSASVTSVKGKEKVLTEDDLVKHQLSEMDQIVRKLEEHMQTAENQHWNLLICAIGAELEAFREAQEMLEAALSDEQGTSQRSSQSGAEANLQTEEHHHDESSDNEVPADLITSHAEETGSLPAFAPRSEDGLTLHSTDSNEVPAEFLAEHHG